jgi:hypothetical protein
MADKVDKPKKKAKGKKDDKGVLAALPSTRPERIGSRRTAATPAATSSTTSAAAAATAKPTVTAKRAATGKRKPAAATAKRTAASPAPGKPAGAKRKPTAAKAASTAARKAAAPRTFEPTQAAESAAGERTDPRPRPVREGAPGIGTGGARDQAPPESSRPSGVEIASTAVKAAGEVAQFGITLGGKALKRVVDRLPKP